MRKKSKWGVFKRIWPFASKARAGRKYTIGNHESAFPIRVGYLRWRLVRGTRQFIATSSSWSPVFVELAHFAESGDTGIFCFTDAHPKKRKMYRAVALLEGSEKCRVERIADSDEPFARYFGHPSAFCKGRAHSKICSGVR